MRIPCRFCEEKLDGMREYIEHLDTKHHDQFEADVKRVSMELAKDIDDRDSTDDLTLWDLIQERVWRVVRRGENDDGKG